MTQRDARLIGGVYRTGQVITTGNMLTTSTAYNRNTNDVVGLAVINLTSAQQISPAVHNLLQTLDRRRTLQSAHVLRVHDWGLEENRIYIATDPPRGVTLQHVLDNENIDVQRAIELIRQLAFGLRDLHERGLSALDLRPQLVTVDTIGVTDRVQIDDVGLRALLLTLGYTSSQRNDDIGYLDPRYSPPEYLYNGQIGPWSDIYQVGLLLFTLVTGRLPYVGKTPAETSILQSTAAIPLMSRYQHDTPPQLQSLLEHALAKNSAQRFANATALLNALASVQIAPRIRHTPNTSIDIEEPERVIQSSANLTKEIQSLQEQLAQRVQTGGRSSSGQRPEGEAALRHIPTATGVYAYLVHEDDKQVQQRFALTQKSTIVGRLDPKRGVTPDLDLSLLDPTMTISRQHARIRFEETFFYIEDLKSRNKTWLGKLHLTPLKAELLQHGDTIQFGSVRLTFEIPGMPPVPTFKPKQGK